MTSNFRRIRDLPHLDRCRLAAFVARGSITMIVVAGMMTAPAFADLWYEHYQKGEEAMKQQNWQEAANNFLEAIQKKPEPGTNLKTYGMNFINYYPYLKLGIAYYNLGRAEQAIQAFESEEAYGAIKRSESDYQNLRTFRDLAQKLKDSAAAANEAKRIASIVQKSLSESGNYERQGSLTDALDALGEGLAVDPENGDLKDALSRLQAKVARERDERDAANRIARALREGKAQIASENWASASSTFQQVLDLDPGNAEARELLDRSRRRLQEQITAQRSARERQALVEEGLSQARGAVGVSAGWFSDRGVQALSRAIDDGKIQLPTAKIAQSLSRLESVLAADPENREAQSLRDLLTRAKRGIDERTARGAEVARLLDEGAGLLKDGKHREAVARFNQLIALDPSNMPARTYLSQAFAAMNDALLSPGGAPAMVKMVPVISLLNQYPDQELEEGQVHGEDLVSSPEYRLAGNIFDDTQEIEFAVHRDLEEQDGGGSSARETRVLKGRKMGPTLYQFRFDERFDLQPGPAGFKILARDGDGLSAEEQFYVRYVPGVWRTPWPYAGGVLVLGAGLAGFQIRRVRRRNLLFKRRFNPYIAGAPILKTDLFLGREALLSRILQTVHNNSLLLYGERRIGKTSLQHQLRKRLKQMNDPEYEFYPVYIDLQGTPEERFFGTIARDMFQELEPLLDEELKGKAPADEAEYTYEQLVRDTRKVLRCLKKKSSKKVKLVLQMDEVDELNDYDPRVNQKLRSLFMKGFAEDLAAVVSGVGIKKHWESEGSPWYNFFEEIPVKPFTREDAEDLIRKPIRGVFDIEPGVVDKIIDATECKPYLIQKACIAIVNKLHDERRRKITMADVEAVGTVQES